MGDNRKELWDLFGEIASKADYAHHLANAAADFDQGAVGGFSDPEKAYEVVPGVLLQTLAATLQEVSRLAWRGIKLTAPDTD
jgi:hypothetical protein